jgi:hypothetical protein
MYQNVYERTVAILNTLKLLLHHFLWQILIMSVQIRLNFKYPLLCHSWEYEPSSCDIPESTSGVPSWNTEKKLLGTFYIMFLLKFIEVSELSFFFHNTKIIIMVYHLALSVECVYFLISRNTSRMHL